MFSKIIPSFFTIKEGSTFLTKPLFPQEREDVTALRCSEPLRYKVGGPSKFYARLCGMGPPGVIAPHCDGALSAYTSPLNNQLYNLHHPTDYKDILLEAQDCYYKSLFSKPQQLSSFEMIHQYLYCKS